MHRSLCVGMILVAGLLLPAMPGIAQVRAVPKKAEGGERQGEPWAEVPETFRHLKTARLAGARRLRSGRTTTAPRPVRLLKLWARCRRGPIPRKVEVVSSRRRATYTLERFQFHNGVDMVVPGILLIPKDAVRPGPAIVGLHGHGSSKESICTDAKNSAVHRPDAGRKGYVVAAIDAYFNGERVGKRPGRQQLESGPTPQEESLFKLNLWLGRTLWGMMLRDEQCLIDYLETRPEVDEERIGATG